MKNRAWVCLFFMMVSPIQVVKADRLYDFGLGFYAGPFDIVLETTEPADYFVVKLSNFESASEFKGWSGGGYRKIGLASSGKALHFPGDWMYDWLFRGTKYISGTINHPLYVMETFYIGMEEVNGENKVGVCFKSHLRVRERDCTYYDSDSDLIIKRKMMTFDEYYRFLVSYYDSPDFVYVNNTTPDEFERWKKLSSHEKAIELVLEKIDTRPDYYHSFYEKMGVLEAVFALYQTKMERNANEYQNKNRDNANIGEMVDRYGDMINQIRGLKALIREPYNYKSWSDYEIVR